MWYSFGACSAMFARAACQSPAHDEAMFLSSDVAFQPWLLVYCPFVAAFQPLVACLLLLCCSLSAPWLIAFSPLLLPAGRCFGVWRDGEGGGYSLSSSISKPQ